MPGRPTASKLLNALLLVAILALTGWYLMLSGTRFDRRQWLAAEADSRTRADMAGDLVGRYRLKGRSYTQIVNLLGPPTRTDRWPEKELAYALGPRRIWQSGRLEWLLFDVDRAGSVTGYEVTHD